MAAHGAGTDRPAQAAGGRFCGLDVDGVAPAAPGVYAWTVDGQVAYVGRDVTRHV